MKNLVFERNYERNRMQSLEHIPPTLTSVVEQALSSGFFDTYKKAVAAMPKCVVLEDKKTYDDLLERLDALARFWGGKIKGVVDYEKWQSSIEVILPTFEFTFQEELKLLSDIAAKTHLVSFSATDNGEVCLYIMINYFQELGDTDKLLEETIMQDEALTDLLEQKYEEEKALIFNDPVLGEYFKKHAKLRNMTIEEIYARFEAIFNDALNDEMDPESFDTESEHED